MKENSYRSIFKGLSAFAGVQAFQIIINLVRGKLVAIFLGPDGMGMASIFNSVFNTFSQASSLGAGMAVVREAAERREDTERVSELTNVVTGLFRWTALLGAVICALFCVQLSRFSFGTPDLAWQFVLLGVALFINGRWGCLLWLLQGLHKVERVAKASLVGALTGLFIGVPLYWLFGNSGIVPAMVALQLALYLFYRFGLRREVGRWKGIWNLRPYWPLVRKLLALGLVLLSGPIIGALCEYGVNLFLRFMGDLDAVGLYQGANSLTNQYSGVVFAAMAMDYFPRLTASIGNRPETNNIVSRQMEIISLAIAPVACAAVIFAPLIIRLLLTSSFESIMPLLRLMSLGVAIKALHFPLGYVAFARDDRRLFFWMECIGSNLLYAAGVVCGYLLGGLEGLGWAFVAENLLTLIVYVIVNASRFHLKVAFRAWREGFVCLGLVCLCFASAFWRDSLEGCIWVPVALMWVSGGVALGYSLCRLKGLLRSSEEDLDEGSDEESDRNQEDEDL